MKNETFLSGEYEHLPNTWDEMFDENGKILTEANLYPTPENLNLRDKLFDIAINSESRSYL